MGGGGSPLQSRAYWAYFLLLYYVGNPQHFCFVRVFVLTASAGYTNRRRYLLNLYWFSGLATMIVYFYRISKKKKIRYTYCVLTYTALIWWSWLHWRRILRAYRDKMSLIWALAKTLSYIEVHRDRHDMPEMVYVIAKKPVSCNCFIPHLPVDFRYLP